MTVHEDASGVFIPFWILRESPSTTSALLLSQITWLFQPSLRGLDRARFTERKGERWLAMADQEMGEQLGMSEDAVYRARAALKKADLLFAMNSKVDGVKRCLVRPNPEVLARRSDSAESREVTAISRNSSHRDIAEPLPLLETDQGEVGERREATRLCGLLAELMVGNGCKPPTITATWVLDMDRMLRLDERTVSQVENAIRWCQADPFWRANILSPRKLREKYEQLRLAAMASPASRKHGMTNALSEAGADELLRQYGAGANGGPPPAAGRALPSAP